MTKKPLKSTAPIVAHMAKVAAVQSIIKEIVKDMRKYHNEDRYTKEFKNLEKVLNNTAVIIARETGRSILIGG